MTLSGFPDSSSIGVSKMWNSRFMSYSLVVTLFLAPFALAQILLAACDGKSKHWSACPQPAVFQVCADATPAQCEDRIETMKFGGYWTCVGGNPDHNCGLGGATDDSICYTQFECSWSLFGGCQVDYSTWVYFHATHVIEWTCAGGY